MIAMDTVMLDSGILYDMMRNPQGAAQSSLRRRLQDAPDLRVMASVVVDCVMLDGLRRMDSPRLQKAWQDLQQVVEIAPLGPEASLHYHHLRSHMERAGRTIGTLDALVAAHALALDATLVSADGGFRSVPGLKLENWLPAA